MSRTTRNATVETYAGFDLSLTGSALVILDNNAQILEEVHIASKLRGMARLKLIRDQTTLVIREFKPVLCCVEGYSYGSKNNREYMGELGGVIRLMLYISKTPYKDVTPGQVKKFVTGLGVAEKNQMMLGVFKNWGYSAPNDDLSDAYTLARIAANLSGHCLTKITKTQREVLNVIQNPPAKKAKKKKVPEE